MRRMSHTVEWASSDSPEKQSQRTDLEAGLFEVFAQPRQLACARQTSLANRLPGEHLFSLSLLSRSCLALHRLLSSPVLRALRACELIARGFNANLPIAHLLATSTHQLLNRFLFAWFQCIFDEFLCTLLPLLCLCLWVLHSSSIQFTIHRN